MTKRYKELDQFKIGYIASSGKFLIPVHPYWDVITKNHTGSFIIAYCDDKDIDRWIVHDKDLHDPIEKMARAANDQIVKGLVEIDRLHHMSACEACAEIPAVMEAIADYEKQIKHWKANHDNRVEAARVLIDRTDMPLERVNAYKLILDLQEKVKELELSIAGLRSGVGNATIAQR